MEGLLATLLILIIITWLSFAIIAAIIGDAKGGNPVGWFFYGLVLPLVAIAHALVRHRTLEEEQRRHTLAGRIACHLCAEYISPKAIVCPFCQRNIERDETPAAQLATASEVGAETQSDPTTEQPANETNSDFADKIFLYGVIGVGSAAIIILLLFFTSN